MDQKKIQRVPPYTVRSSLPLMTCNARASYPQACSPPSPPIKDTFIACNRLAILPLPFLPHHQSFTFHLLFFNSSSSQLPHSHSLFSNYILLLLLSNYSLSSSSSQLLNSLFPNIIPPPPPSTSLSLPFLYFLYLFSLLILQSSSIPQASTALPSIATRYVCVYVCILSTL